MSFLFEFSLIKIREKFGRLRICEVSLEPDYSDVNLGRLCSDVFMFIEKVCEYRINADKRNYRNGGFEFSWVVKN